MVLPSQPNTRVATSSDRATMMESLRANVKTFQRTNNLFSSRNDLQSAEPAESHTVEPSQAVLSAKHRFRQQYHQKKAQKPQQNNDNKHPPTRLAKAVAFTQSTYVCPKCSLPLLEQDLASTKVGGSRVILSRSSSSTTTARTFPHDGASMEEFTIHDFDTMEPPNEKNEHGQNNLPKEPITGSSCGLMLPMLSALEQFVGMYCDSVCADQMIAARGKGYFSGMQKNQYAGGVRKVPPYCANCKAFVVQETRDEGAQDQMLTNLASWLATSSSSTSTLDDAESDDGGKPSKVSFRPSRGSITVVLDGAQEPKQQQRSTEVLWSADKFSSTQPTKQQAIKSSVFDVTTNAGEAFEWDSLMHRRTPRIGIVPRNSVNSSPESKDRYVVQELEIKQMRSYGSTSSVGRSPGRRRQRPSLSMLDDTMTIMEKTTPDLQPQNNHLSLHQRPSTLQVQSKESNTFSSGGDEQNSVSSPTVSSKSLTSLRRHWHDDAGDGFLDERNSSNLTVPKFLTNEPKKVEVKVMDILSKQDDVTDKNEIASVAMPMTILGHMQDELEKQAFELTSEDHDDDGSVGTCYTIKEEATIIKDYEKKREIATKAIGRKLMDSYVLTQTQCSHCQMPLMEFNGISECVVCPLVSKKAKKRAALIRKGQAIMATFDSDSPPKRKQDSSHVQSPKSPTDHRDDGDSRGPFEAMKQRAEAEELEEINGILINWDEDIQSEDHGNFSPQNCVQTINDTLLQDASECDESVQKESDCSGSDVYEMEIGSQEVYRRLLGGWLLTNTLCPTCQSPLMQSSGGDIECAVCNSTGSEVSSPRHPGKDFADPQDLTHQTFEESEKNTETLIYDTAMKMDDPAVQGLPSQTSPMIYSDGNGLRFLALPDNLDTDDHDALLAFLTQAKRQQTTLEQKTLMIERQDFGAENEFKGSAVGKELLAQVSTDRRDRGSHGASFAPDSESNLALDGIGTIFSPLNSSKHQRHASFESRHTPNLSSRSLRTTDLNGLYDYHQSRLETDLEVRSMRTDVDPREHLQHWSSLKGDDSSPNGADALSMVVSDFTSRLLPGERERDSMRQEKQEISIGSSTPLYKSHLESWDVGKSSMVSRARRGSNPPASNRAASVPRATYREVEKRPSSSREVVIREISPRSETGAVLDLNDNEDLILKFDTAKSFPSDECRSPSPHLPQQSFLMKSTLDRLQHHDNGSHDVIVKHSNASRSTRLETRCKICDNTLRSKGKAHDAVCVNPKCTVYMIPLQNIDIFNTAMKDAKDTHDQDFERHEQSHSKDNLKDHDGRKRAPTQIRGESWKSDDIRRHGIEFHRLHLQGKSLFIDDIDSHLSHDSKLASNDAVNVLLTRISGGRNKELSTDNFQTDKCDDKSDMAKLIDRLASAAVAIKDLEQSVQEAELSSPERSFNGRPPTSPTLRSFLNRSGADVRWL